MYAFARILVDRSCGQKLDYSIPEELRSEMTVGSRVIVMVQKRRAVGTILELFENSDIPGMRPIIGRVEGGIALTPVMMRLAEWMTHYYCATYSSIMRAMLPSMLRKENILEKKIQMARLIQKVSLDDFAIFQKKAPKQRAILEYLNSLNEPVSVSKLLLHVAASHSSLKALKSAGYVEIFTQSVLVDHTSAEEILNLPMPHLNADQKLVIQKLYDAIDALENDHKIPPPFLLHGVTGSGKTEVYLRTIARVLESGKGALVLVPEIVLTPQTLERFRSRFDHIREGGAGIAVFHSHLTDSERRQEWLRLQSGEAKICIGARSAIFAPVKNLGIIIVDEEHENTYKQEEAPRYHARDVAVMRARLEGCPVLLGSATPSLESYHNTMIGKYSLLQLPHRADHQLMPFIRLVDLRLQGKRAKSEGGLSAPLQMAITKRLQLDQQTILFLNRRGFSTSTICQACGHICRCPNCNLALTLHRAESRMLCHLCGHVAKPFTTCPECHHFEIQNTGIGTQRVEESMRKLFPMARIARVDGDTMRSKKSYEELIGKFRARQIDILIGTQMIAKGLDFPNVTLIGIINADIGLHAPDFRAGERTFQLLTQVAGRAGRGDMEGEVIVQTFSPSSPSIQYARHHDYIGFYEQEILFRQAFQHPPFSRMLLLQLRGVVLESTANDAHTIATQLKISAPSGIEVSKAVPAPLERTHGQYRYHIMLKSSSHALLGKFIREARLGNYLSHGVMITIDVDPYFLM